MTVLSKLANKIQNDIINLLNYPRFKVSLFPEDSNAPFRAYLMLEEFQEENNNCLLTLSLQVVISHTAFIPLEKLYNLHIIFYRILKNYACYNIKTNFNMLSREDRKNFEYVIIFVFNVRADEDYVRNKDIFDHARQITKIWEDMNNKII